MVEQSLRKGKVGGSTPPIGSLIYMIYTYLIKSIKYETFYTGISKNPYERLKIHNGGGLLITKAKRPFELVYMKAHNDYAEARRHEIWLKKKNVIYKNKLADVAQLAPPS